MGKRIPLDTVYCRPKQTGQIKPYKLSDPLPDEVLNLLTFTNEGLAAMSKLADLRAKKTASQRKWRARQKAAKT